MCTFEFIFIMKMMSKFSDQFVTISASLQKPNIDLMGMYSKLQNFINFVEITLNDQIQFDKIFEDAFLSMIQKLT